MKLEQKNLIPLFVKNKLKFLLIIYIYRERERERESLLSGSLCNGRRVSKRSDNVLLWYELVSFNINKLYKLINRKSVCKVA